MVFRLYVLFHGNLCEDGSFHGFLVHLDMGRSCSIVGTYISIPMPGSSGVFGPEIVVAAVLHQFFHLVKFLHQFHHFLAIT